MWVIVGSPADVRVIGFQRALQAMGRRPARLISYADVIAGRFDLPPGCFLRIESPGKDANINRQITEYGAALTGITLPPTEPGELGYPAHWYAGFRAVLGAITERLTPNIHLTNHPAEIALMFDKARCHRLLTQAGISTAPALEDVTSFEGLLAAMERTPRVFVKLRYGSSASGVVALRTDGRRFEAFTTVELVETRAGLRLYNTRRIIRLTDRLRIAQLVNALSEHHIHVERWLPKAGFRNYTFDLRVVVIAGEVRHTVARLSKSPMTNLHLLNARCPVDELNLPEPLWGAIQRSCQRAMACFPRSLYAGLDVLVEPGFRRSTVLEVNAFGDLLHGVTHRGQDTYTAEIEAMYDQCQ